MTVYCIAGVVLTGCIAMFSFIIVPRYGVFGYVVALIVALFSATIFSLIAAGAYKYLSFGCVRKSALLEMLKYSVPLVPNGIMWWLVSSFNRPLMETYLGMDSIGLLAVANKLPAIVTILASIFGVSWHVSVLEEFNKEGYQNYFNKILRIVMAGLVTVFFVITLMSEYFIKIMTDEKFYQAWIFVPVLTLGAVLQSISGFAGSNFSAVRKSKYFFYSSVWGAATALVLNFLLIPRFGIMGAAVAISVSFAVMAISRILYGWQYVRIQNLPLYLLMIILCVIAVIINFVVNNALLRMFVTISLLLIFLIANYRLKDDLLILLKTIKHKYVKKNL
jgi:O-antigen/teichoic acid export membrane protein